MHVIWGEIARDDTVKLLLLAEQTERTILRKEGDVVRAINGHMTHELSRLNDDA